MDQKGRVAIPAGFREALREGLVLTRTFDKCIVIYPVAEWRRLADRLSSLPLTREAARRVARSIFANAYRLELDRQGRVLVPPALKEYAEIRDGVVFAGNNDCLEMWSQEHWAAEKAIMDKEARQWAEEVGI